MKKVFASIIALLIMSSVGFAQDAKTKAPAKKMTKTAAPAKKDMPAKKDAKATKASAKPMAK